MVGYDAVALPSYAPLLSHRHTQKGILLTALLGCVGEDGSNRPLSVAPDSLCRVDGLMNLVLRLIDGDPWRYKVTFKLVVALYAEIREFAWLCIFASVLCRRNNACFVGSRTPASLLILRRADYVE